MVQDVSYNRLTVCTYMVDLWCLGVKDTLGPRKLDQTGYKQLINAVYTLREKVGEGNFEYVAGMDELL